MRKIDFFTKRSAIRCFLAMMLICILGCPAGVTPTIMPASSDLTPAEQTLLKFEAAYLQQFQDTMSMAKMPNLTPEQKALVVKKKALLTQVKPLINAYSLAVLAGNTPTIAQEQAIYDILNQLGTKL